MLNARLDHLVDYPFRRLDDLLGSVPPGRDPLLLHLGEPRHAMPALALEALARLPEGWGRYPPAAGCESWKKAVAAWIRRRFSLPEGMVPESAILPASGSREALYMLGQAAIPIPGKPVAVMPNPFYQVYFASAAMAGAETVFLRTDVKTGLPDPDALDREIWDKTAIVTICSPANPQGTTLSLAAWKTWIELARAHDFILVADECYSEIYSAAPPTGILEACRDLGGSLSQVAVFNSLSKRSSVPGMRSGFVTGDPDLMARFQRLRSYAAAGMPLPIQEAAAALWSDETHVEDNRALYRQKIDDAARIIGNRFGFVRPVGGFFLWLNVGTLGLDGETAAQRLWSEAGVKVLPGRYLSRQEKEGQSAGDAFIRAALVNDRAATAEALERLVAVLTR